MDNRNALLLSRGGFSGAAVGQNAAAPAPLTDEQKAEARKRGTTVLIGIFAALLILSSGSLYALHRIEVD